MNILVPYVGCRRHPRMCIFVHSPRYLPDTCTRSPRWQLPPDTRVRSTQRDRRSSTSPEPTGPSVCQRRTKSARDARLFCYRGSGQRGGVAAMAASRAITMMSSCINNGDGCRGQRPRYLSMGMTSVHVDQRWTSTGGGRSFLSDGSRGGIKSSGETDKEPFPRY